jgi:hypothetical protein
MVLVIETIGIGLELGIEVIVSGAEVVLVVLTVLV